MSTDPKRWQRVQDLCHAALDRGAAERGDFLLAACEGDEALRREVESLLVQERQADDFLSASALGAVAHAVVGQSRGSLIGSRLGVYEIVARIGGGGMGDVYRARDTKLQREVAIKVLSDVFVGDPDRLARFQREALVLASLNHPHIGAIYGLEESSVYALVLELVEGPTLMERIAQGPMSLDETLSIAGQIAAALEAAHERGIVHRDLKPANVKIRPDGTVKVLDFGLAKATADDGRNLTWSPTVTVVGRSDGLILGTAAYMSPEQARGRAVDKRADIWAFGCVLYEMLTGRPPFDGETVSDTIAAILTREPEWNRLPEWTPSGIRRLLRRSLDKELKRRLRDVADARLDIDDALTGIADLRDAAPARRDTAREVEFQRLTDFAGMKESPAVSPDGKIVAFVALVRGRRQIWLRLLAGGPPLQVTHDDVDHEQPRWAPDSSTLIYYTAAANPSDHGALWEISALGGPPRRIASTVGAGDISHDGRRIALFQSSAEHIDLLIIARDGSHPTRVARLPSQYLYASLRWSPDDRSIAFQRSTATFTNYLEIIPAAGGEARELARSEWLGGFSWLPDGSELVYSSSRGSTLLYPPIFNLRAVGRDGRHDRQLTYGDVSYVEPDIHPSGKILISRIRGHSDIWRFPVDGTAIENTRNAVRITRQAGQAQTPSVSPDGTEVVYLSDNGGHGNLWIARTDGSSARQITYERDPAVSIGVPMWSPAGDWIVFLVARGWQSTLVVIRPDGSGLRALVPKGWGAYWSHDGTWVYYATTRDDGPPYLEKIPIDGGVPVVVRSDVVWTAAVAPDDATVYYARGLTTDLLGLVGDFEIRRGLHADGPSERIGRIAGSRVPVSPRLLQMFLSPDSQWLAVPLVDGATSNVWALPTSGGPLKQLTDFGERSIVIARSVSWSADSQFLYAAVAEAETDIVLFDGLLER